MAVDSESGKALSRIMREAGSVDVWGPTGALGFASRLTGWGLLTAVASSLLSTALGASLPLYFFGAVGFVAGGLGAAAWSALVLRRWVGVRTVWRIGALLGIPFGVSSVVLGLWSFFIPTPQAAFDPPAIVAASMAVFFAVGLALSVLLGVDIGRYVLGSRPSDEGDSQAPPHDLP